MRSTKVCFAATSMNWTRREFLGTCLAGAVGLPLAAQSLSASTLLPSGNTARDQSLLDELERAAFDFFWNEADPHTGLIRDRAKADGGETCQLSSIASTGFGLTALCIGHFRNYRDQREIADRIATTLHFLANKAPHVNGYLYHFVDMRTGERAIASEISPIDMAILLCGALTCRAYFGGVIRRDATKLYHRVDWKWATAGGDTFVLDWTPESGFSSQRWDYYCESLMMYLLSIGAPTNPLPAQSWNRIHRPVMTYEQYRFISIAAPLFVHQFSHAWFDFRGKHDGYANYFENSTVACRAHREFCMELGKTFPCYSKDTWGITSSDSSNGYVAWGGPPIQGPIDGTIVPAAAAGSLPFIYGESMDVLRTLRTRYGDKIWKRYGFVDAFNPLTGWTSPDVIGIDVGISMLMAENARSNFVWDMFAKNPEVNVAMQKAGFKRHARSARA